MGRLIPHMAKPTVDLMQQSLARPQGGKGYHLTFLDWSKEYPSASECPIISACPFEVCVVESKNSCRYLHFKCKCEGKLRHNSVHERAYAGTIRHLTNPQYNMQPPLIYMCIWLLPSAFSNGLRRLTNVIRFLSSPRRDPKCVETR